jgi:hypothetical protein
MDLNGSYSYNSTSFYTRLPDIIASTSFGTTVNIMAGDLSFKATNLFITFGNQIYVFKISINPSKKFNNPKKK